MNSVTDLYAMLNANIVNMRESETTKNARLAECTDYYQCVLKNKTFVEKYQSLSIEITENFDKQQFNLKELQGGFAQIGILDGKLAVLRGREKDIRKFLKERADGILPLPSKCYQGLAFRGASTAISKVDKIFDDLQKAEKEAEERRCRRIENWKIVGKVVWTIIKYTAMVVGFIFVIIGFFIKVFMSSKDDN